MKRVSVVNITLCTHCEPMLGCWCQIRTLFVIFFWQERESAVSEAYSKGVKEGKEQAGANEKQPSVNVTDEVS